MVSPTDSWAGTLETWSSRLFHIAGLSLLVGVAAGVVTILAEGYAYTGWAALTLEVGRLAALLGTVGLTVELANRRDRLGALGMVVGSLAVVFTLGLVTMATVNAIVGSGPVIPGLGLATYVLSVCAFALVGGGIASTRAHPDIVGWLLLANVGALLVVFFGRLVVPLWVVATVVPAVQVLLYVAIGYRLVERPADERTAHVSETVH